MPSVFISTLSLFVSCLALSGTYVLYRLSRADHNTITNVGMMMSVEARLQESPSLLRFHGITDEALMEAGLTSSEFAYLLNSFTAGRLGYLDGGLAKAGTFKPGSYRHTMLLNLEVRKAWPLLRPLIDPCPYRDAIDRTVVALDASTSSDPRSEPAS